MAPVPDGGCVRVSGGGRSLEFLGTAYGGDGGGRTLLAHYDWARAAELAVKEARVRGNGSRYSEEEDGGGGMWIKALCFFLLSWRCKNCLAITAVYSED
jgi:hypothetical protein